MKKTTTVISAAVLGILGTIVLTSGASVAKTMAAAEHKACPMLAKICPDGIHTSSPQGPNCEFSPCPGEPGYKEDGAKKLPAPVAPPSGATAVPPGQQDAPGSTGGYDGEPMIDPGAFDNGDVPQQSMPVMPAPLQTTPPQN